MKIKAQAWMMFVLGVLCACAACVALSIGSTKTNVKKERWSTAVGNVVGRYLNAVHDLEEIQSEFKDVKGSEHIGRVVEDSLIDVLSNIETNEVKLRDYIRETLPKLVQERAFGNR